MQKNFWNSLKKPFFVMAPLANVTDSAFRRVIAKHSRMGKRGGGPTVMWTEFVSADGLCSDEGKKALLKDLEYTESERPIVAQLFSSNPEKMEKACRIVAELGFDGIDINMGCPDKTIEKQGAGAAMIKTPKLAKEVVEAALRGAGGLPVSVKTRIGYNKDELKTWLPTILSLPVSAVTVHARTRKEMSLVPARWEHVKEAVEIRNKLKSSALIIGNGDALSLADGRKKLEESGADGVMFGRAIFGNPWLFDETRPYEAITLKEKLDVLVEHTKLFEKLIGGHKNFALMKKHYKAYVNGFDGAKELRVRLMETENAEQVEDIVTTFLKDQDIDKLSNIC